jgi:uncharacterized membrane protein
MLAWCAVLASAPRWHPACDAVSEEAVMAHYSRATIKGHPIHAMLVGFPIAFYTSGVGSLIGYAVTRTPFWYEAAMYLLFAGVATAIVAAVFGAIDLFAGIPRDTRARSTGIKHMGLNVASLILFAGAASMLASRWVTDPVANPGTHLDYGAALVVSLVGIVLTIAAGSLGGRLVYKHHVGMSESPTPDELRGGELGGTAAPRTSAPQPWTG